MAKETVQAVRQAELNAAQKEKDAILRKDAILSEARHNASNLIASMTKDAREKVAAKMKAAEQKSSTMSEAAKIKAEKEVMMIKEMAKRKEDAAINLVLTTVIKES